MNSKKIKMSQTTSPACDTLHGSHGEELRGIDLAGMSKLSAEGMTIGVVSSRWQAAICDRLVEGIKEAVEPAGGTVVVECKSLVDTIF